MNIYNVIRAVVLFIEKGKRCFITIMNSDILDNRPYMYKVFSLTRPKINEGGKMWETDFEFYKIKLK